ncbi:Na-translocating system protein MpsC family protein [Virgibacillus sp. C22-A2]|uniref:Na-translocating system protein MpsC family protein n=1 Tax=Virgibacillus tibetensis TaxID=3042313 RepID=A0ABU6KGH8_9BACI|nr:Na-translocating system protein MpsC family protein [Virgibacillus sp. C22-A2]
MDKKTVESAIASSTGRLLRDNFGKGPGSIYVTVVKPFITIYLKSFLAPMERVLLNQDNTLRVQETRDILMNELLPEIKLIFSSETGTKVSRVFYDWSLENKTGMIFAEMDSIENETDEEFLSYQAKDEVHNEIDRFTKKAQKSPRELRSFKLNSRTIISKREDILVRIEQELIESGFEKQLRISKRRLEKNLINRGFLESVLNQEIQDIFVDWDFHNDIGYVIFVLLPDKVKLKEED